MQALKDKAIRGGAVKIIGQATCLVLRIGTIMVVARLIAPNEFGIVAMVTVVTGLFDIFAGGGLSAAMIQKETVTDEQISTLFWINVALGALLALLCVLIAPVVGSFYHEPRTVAVLVALAPCFFLNGLTTQHFALVERQMRYTAVVAIEVVSQILSSVLTITLAVAGLSYWSLVGGSLLWFFLMMAGAWIACWWLPSAPRRGIDVRSFIRFGSTLVLNNLVVYVGYNFEKLLLGRAFGSDALGTYSRSYQLTLLPTQMMHTALGSVAFSALSRLQDQPARLRSYFLKGYSIVVSMMLPVAMFCAVLADDIILVLLGPKWTQSAPIFQLLAPTILVFGIINPLSWLMQSTGHQGRSLRIALVLAPVVIVAYLVGLPYGPRGVAMSYAIAMMLWLVPHVFWSVHGTPISARDLLAVVVRPLGATFGAALAALVMQQWTMHIPFAIVRLVLCVTVGLVVYGALLLNVMKQKDFYQDVLRGLKRA